MTLETLHVTWKSAGMVGRCPVRWTHFGELHVDYHWGVPIAFLLKKEKEAHEVVAFNSSHGVNRVL